MYLYLKNFRHYQSEEFNLPDYGFNLITGDSGIGKTTIFNAIYHALYGGVRNPYSILQDKKEDCYVYLEMEINERKLKVKRSNRPNRLIVNYLNEEYEDDEAQSVVENTLRLSKNEFLLSSYFDQDHHKPVLSMKPSEQLSFLETLAYSNGDHEYVKENIKKHIRNLDNELKTVKNKRELYEKQVEEKQNNLTKNYGDIPEDFDKDYVKEEFDELTEKISNIQKELKNERNEYKKALSKEEEKKKVEENKKKLENEIEYNRQKIEELGRVLTKDEIKELEDEIEEYQTLEENIRNIKESLEIDEEVEQMKEKYFNDIYSQLDNLYEELWSQEEYDDVKNRLNYYTDLRKQYENDLRNYENIKERKETARDNINEVKQDIVEYFKPKYKKTVNTPDKLHKFLKDKYSLHSSNLESIENKIKYSESEILTCPNCDNEVLLTDDGLEKIDNNNNNESEDLNKLNEEYDDEYYIVEYVEEKLEEVKKYLDDAKLKLPKKPQENKYMSLNEFSQLSKELSEQETLFKKVTRLEEIYDNEEIPDYIKEKIDKAKEKRIGIPDDINSNQDLKDIQNKIKNLEKKYTEENRKLGEYSKLNREINDKKKKLDNKKEYTLKTNSKNIYKNIEKLENDLDNYNAKYSEIQNKLALVEKIEYYDKIKEEKENLEYEIEELTSKENELRERLEGSYELDKSAKEAEFLSLQKTIDSINEHAKVYLDYMFDEEINVKLIVDRYTKKGKEKSNFNIRVFVEYDGKKFDNIGDMSHGERQRCNLAFLLAVNDMLNSKILMLDECFNNLHEDRKIEMMNYIRELANNKQVFVITHTVIEGLFDNVIKLP